VRAAHGRLWDASVCSLAPGDLLPAYRGLGVPLLELERYASPGLLRLRALRRYVAKQRFDVVHSMLWHANVHARLAVAGLSPRPAVAISERNAYPTRPWPRVAIDLVLARWTDVYIANSDAVADFTRRMHPVDAGSLVTIPNAVDRTIFYPPAQRRASGSFRIGSIGRLEPEKGFDTLIAASWLLQRRFPDVEIVVAGTGSLRRELEGLAAGSPVRFVGTLDPGEPVADFLRGLDVFVLPSHHSEGRPNVVLEALACGIAVVATEAPGIPEIIDDPSLTVPPGDAAALAAGLGAVLADPNARARGGESAGVVPTFEELGAQYRRVFELAIARRDVVR
jgi:glycosyltransferase involved in cell wall biosynthesis